MNKPKNFIYLERVCEDQILIRYKYFCILHIDPKKIFSYQYTGRNNGLKVDDKTRPEVA